LTNSQSDDTRDRICRNQISIPPETVVMTIQTGDLRILQRQPLITPAVLAEELPLTEGTSHFVRESRQTVQRILEGKDQRLLAIVGPCSIHDPAAAEDYAGELHSATSELAEALFTVMRVYFEKPRTTVGWKGLINDPDLDGSFHINKGLHLARRLMLTVNSSGLPVASEFLDTTFGQYYAELVSFGALGARTVESQVHRELASGLSMPVGIKNRTDGEIGVAIDAVLAARCSHWFPSITREGAPAILQSSGNEQCFLVLRGGDQSGPNYEPEVIQQVAMRLGEKGLRQAVIVDCSHGNSSKDFSRQPVVAHSVANQLGEGNQVIRGIMLESHLIEGAQTLRPEQPLTYGQSITDGCLSLQKTVSVLEELAEAVARRMQKQQQ
jgi:3-deoxy-7-phosphoheptulonate synthase